MIRTRQTCPFTIDAVVLLPDHLHCVPTLLPRDGGFGRRQGLIKAHVSRRTGMGGEGVVVLSPSRAWRREHGFWQRRFRAHTIRDDEDLSRHVDDIHANPVRHGFVDHVRD